MKTADYIIALKENKVVQCPTTIKEVEDLDKLYNGLNNCMQYAYDYIENFNKTQYKSMSQLRDCCDTIQFCTAQISSVRIAYNDLVGRIVEHNKQLENKGN